MYEFVFDDCKFTGVKLTKELLDVLNVRKNKYYPFDVHRKETVYYFCTEYVGLVPSKIYYINNNLYCYKNNYITESIMNEIVEITGKFKSKNKEIMSVKVTDDILFYLVLKYPDLVIESIYPSFNLNRKICEVREIKDE